MRCFECWSFPFPMLDVTVILLRQKLKHNYTHGVFYNILCPSPNSVPSGWLLTCVCTCMYRLLWGRKYIQRFLNEMPVWHPAPSELWKLRDGCYSSLFLSVKHRTSSPVRSVLRCSVEWALSSQFHLPGLLPLLSL